jgi:hypothetical protein
VRRLIVLMAVALGMASAYLKAFDVAPTHYDLSGTISGDPQYGGVAETFIAQFDSAAEVGAGLDFATARMTISQRS